MQKSILFIFIFLVQFTLLSQEKTEQFPEDFLGIYKGTLLIDSPKGKQKITMEFHLKATKNKDRFDYVLIYEGKPRNYTLVKKNMDKGQFELYENNGIILPTKYVNRTLFSFFEVQGNILSSRLSFTKQGMDFEILFNKTDNKIKTGKGTDEIPFVFAYPITTVQQAHLNKVESF